MSGYHWEGKKRLIAINHQVRAPCSGVCQPEVLAVLRSQFCFSFLSSYVSSRLFVCVFGRSLIRPCLCVSVRIFPVTVGFHLRQRPADESHRDSVLELSLSPVSLSDSVSVSVSSPLKRTRQPPKEARRPRARRIRGCRNRDAGGGCCGRVCRGCSGSSSQLDLGQL